MPTKCEGRPDKRFMCNRNKTKHSEKHSYSLSLSQFNFYLYSLLRFGWLLARKNRFILQKVCADFPLFAYGICRMQICDGTFASFHIIILFYFILFTAFIYLFTLHSLKGTDKRVPSSHSYMPSLRAVTPPRWSTVGQGRVLLPFNNAPQHCLSLWPWNLFLMVF